MGIEILFIRAFRIIGLGFISFILTIWILGKILGVRPVAQDMDEYLKLHPDLCPYIETCKTYSDLKCHNLRSHRACEEFKRLEWK
jgi:hypothetical protein